MNEHFLTFATLALLPLSLWPFLPPKVPRVLPGEALKLDLVTRFRCERCLGENPLVSEDWAIPDPGWVEEGTGWFDLGCAGWCGWYTRTVLGLMSAHCVPLSALYMSIFFSGTQAFTPSTCCLGYLNGQCKGKIIVMIFLKVVGSINLKVRILGF